MPRKCDDVIALHLIDDLDSFRILLSIHERSAGRLDMIMKYLKKRGPASQKAWAAGVYFEFWAGWPETAPQRQRQSCPSVV